MTKPHRSSGLHPEREPLIQPHQLEADTVRFPDIADLAGRLRFSPNEGRIWLDGQRMLLIHADAFGALRRELMDSLGVDRARGLLTRMGYQAGAMDARLARRVRRAEHLEDLFHVGPQLHGLEGMVQVEPVRLEIDVARGHYYGEYLWKGSAEDEQHSQFFGISVEPQCWTQIGYACGYTSEFMGRPILFREVECQSMGQATCRIVGRPVEEWPDAEDDLRFLQAEQFVDGLIGARTTRAPNELRSGAGAPPSLLDDVSIVGVSSGFNSVCHMIKRVAQTQATVLFQGESGVGKEVFAQALHRISRRQSQPYIALNCAAIPEALIESELFGVEKGAFTGAVQSRLGRFERADGGTLFLDEIGTLSMSSQGKLLRALQEGEIERLGDIQTRRVDVRVIAATNADLRAAVAAGAFREDLYYRLNVFPIRIPPLRDRREDIPVLMNHFLVRLSQRHERSPSGFTVRAIDAMFSYGWPGNIRELENVIERGVINASDHGPIDVGHLFTGGEEYDQPLFGLDAQGTLSRAGHLQETAARSADGEFERVTRRVNELLLSDGGANTADQASLDEIETALMKRALQHCHGNISASARLLGISRAQLAYRLKMRAVTYEKD